MKQVWSCGGGTQSAAIAALIIQGRLPKPDYAVMVDTEREKSSTWEFVNGVIKPHLAAVGVDLVVVPKSRYATVDLYRTIHIDDPDDNGDDSEDVLLLPAYTSAIEGSIGKLPGYCSNEWKRRVIMRWIRAEAEKTQPCQIWIGISTDELRRVRKPTSNWFQERYPLIFDVPMNRANCKSLARDTFGVDPPRSSCWMCPHMSDREWMELRDRYPDDFAKALVLDEEIRTIDPHAFLHRSGQPLVQIASQIGNTDQLALAIAWARGSKEPECQSGYCFV